MEENNNIFEDAKWGQKFKTANNRQAIYLGREPIKDRHILVLDDQWWTMDYMSNGRIDVGWKRPINGPHPLDIVQNDN